MMFIYTLLEFIAGIVIGILLTCCTKRASGYTYRPLDKVGRITNIVLVPAYLSAAPFCLFIGMICEPAYGGFYGFLGWVASFIIASALLGCGLGLGLSVALRKKGKSGLSFAMQFLGAVAISVTVILFALCYDGLLVSLN